MYYGSAMDLSKNKYYTWIKWTNLVFFFLFRFSALVMMIYGLIRDFSSAPNLPIYCFLCLTAGVILFLSILLFKRVFEADFIDIKNSSGSKPMDKVFQSVMKSNENQSSINSIVVPGVSPLSEQLQKGGDSLFEKPQRESTLSKSSATITPQTSVLGVPATIIATPANNVTSK